MAESARHSPNPSIHRISTKPTEPPPPPEAPPPLLNCAALTVSARAIDPLASLFASPLYEAVIVWLPAASVAAVYLAEPAVSLTRSPTAAEPSIKVTVPVGSVPATVAVNVTACPAVTVVAELDSEVVDKPFLTASTTVPDVLAAFWLSPPYTAEMLWAPIASAEVL
jgi:hypothetical protein